MRVDDALSLERTSMYILSFFAGVALVLAAMGIFGVLAQSVVARRREIGIRLALGAPPASSRCSRSSRRWRRTCRCAGRYIPTR
jgi:ABC-type antimicrobial peptide transport system permease subunit